jgi:hypothetical protein
VLRRLLLSASGLAILMVGTFTLPVAAATQPTTTAAPNNCSQAAGNFFGLPRWDKYLLSESLVGEDSNDQSDCTVRIEALSDIWKIALAVVEILTRLAAYIAVGFIIFAGFQYSFSQGDSNRTAQARNTILYAVIGLIITIGAIGVINLLGKTFS